MYSHTIPERGCRELILGYNTHTHTLINMHQLSQFHSPTPHGGKDVTQTRETKQTDGQAYTITNHLLTHVNLIFYLLLNLELKVCHNLHAITHSDSVTFPSQISIALVL